LISGEAERRARFICEGFGRLGALAALVETDSPFAALYAQTRLAGQPFMQFGARNLGLRAETELIDRAFAI
jgi:putative acyl-CoA dehydrogenase